jgi:hypothetical protein
MKSNTRNTEQLGINAAQTILTEEFGWIFRERSKADIGIDAEAEVEHEGVLIQIQIKTGQSHFSVLKNAKDGLTYYIDKYHFDYWSSLKAPVLFIAHIPEGRKTYWQVVSSKTLAKSSKSSWKLFIPFANELNTASREIILDSITDIKIHNLIVRDNQDTDETTVEVLLDLGRVRNIGYQDEKGYIVVDNPSILSFMSHVFDVASSQVELTQLKKLSSLHPLDYSLKMAIAVKYMQMGNSTEASTELTALIYGLKNAQTAASKIFLPWGRFYLNLLQDSPDDFSSKMRSAKPIAFIKYEIIGENTSSAQITATASFDSHEEVLEEKGKNIFLLPSAIPLGDIVPRNLPRYVKTKLTFGQTPHNLPLKLQGITSGYYLGILYEDKILSEFSELL